jgi:putative methyltransferase (TIGR04325 family)
VRLRYLLERLVPPIVMDACRTYRSRSPSSQIWTGVYRDFASVPVSGHGFEGRIWSHLIEAETERARVSHRDGGTIPPRVTDENALLPLLVSTIAGRQDGVRVLDFGGGAGATYADVRAGCPQASALDYHIVETAAVCQIGERVFHDDSGVRFHRSLPDTLPAVDVVYVRSALQYIDDYAGLLRTLASYQATYLLLVHLSAGDVPTFATAQHNVSGSVLPYWFVNVGEIVDVVTSYGYDLAFKGASRWSYAQAALPPSHRLRVAANLLFQRQAAELEQPVALSSNPAPGPGS